MSRSTAITLLFVILPSFAHGQEGLPRGVRTHEVREGETLWGLADRYLGNPYRWPLIYEANHDDIPDPDEIEPGQTLIIPGVRGEAAPDEDAQAAQVQGVMVVGGGPPEAGP
ncbi:MAG: LysM peptidoglycan-binding domain-containing protein, partial [Gemmatimonadetes bacterium]|nr:LysM peptidoglycan-binding domain-containing protein [Gemmatimonadota bacterium]